MSDLDDKESKRRKRQADDELEPTPPPAPAPDDGPDDRDAAGPGATATTNTKPSTPTSRGKKKGRVYPDPGFSIAKTKGGSGRCSYTISSKLRAVAYSRLKCDDGMAVGKRGAATVLGITPVRVREWESGESRLKKAAESDEKAVGGRKKQASHAGSSSSSSSVKMAIIRTSLSGKATASAAASPAGATAQREFSSGTEDEQSRRCSRKGKAAKAGDRVQQDETNDVQPIEATPGDSGLLGDGTVRINVWASPRSLSTALMYSFAQRPDTVVYDEPLYAHFLRTHGEETWRPYRDKVFEEQDSDGDRWIRDVALGPTEKPVVYMKHMAKQVRNLDISFLPKCRNIIQIRTPVHMIPSWNTNIGATMKEMGTLDQLHIYSMVRAMGQEPIVIDADLLRANPEGVLREATEMAGIPFSAKMLSWPAGPKPYDGCWGSLWYEGCWKSTDFDNSPRYVKFDQKLAPLLEECMPIYQLLRSKALTGYGKLGKVPRALPSTAEHAQRDEAASGAAAVNEGVLVWVGDGLVPRGMAKVSVFDSAVQGGDAVWEGIRVYRGKVFMLDRHLQRLQDSAHALAFEDIPSSEDITVAIMATLAANDMTDGVHARVTLTRGVKTTSSMNPRFNVFGCTLIVLAERKPVGGAATYDNTKGVTLITASNRRNPPQCLDSIIHHNNLLNNILPKVQANEAGAADAVMLDVEGFVSETNATNIFLAKGGVLSTPWTGSGCLPGITRGIILEIAAELGMPAKERRVTLSELYCADEVFTTGTMGELTPVVKIDGRQIAGGKPGPLTARLRQEFEDMTDREGSGTPLPAFGQGVGVTS